MASRQATQLLKLVKRTFPKAKVTETALGEMITIKKEFSNSVIVLAEILVENPNQYFVHQKHLKNQKTKTAGYPDLLGRGGMPIKTFYLFQKIL